MKYQYSVVSGQANTYGHYTRRPIVEVEISNGKTSRKFLGLIDSGADHIIMSAAIAEVFGLDRSHCRPWSLMGITMDPSPGFIGELTLKLQYQQDSFRAPVIFLDSDVPVLLGREGFFDRYRIKFEQDHDTFEITPGPRK